MWYSVCTINYEPWTKRSWQQFNNGWPNYWPLFFKRYYRVAIKEKGRSQESFFPIDDISFTQEINAHIMMQGWKTTISKQRICPDRQLWLIPTIDLPFGIFTSTWCPESLSKSPDSWWQPWEPCSLTLAPDVLRPSWGLLLSEQSHKKSLSEPLLLLLSPHEGLHFSNNSPGKGCL